MKHATWVSFSEAQRLLHLSREAVERIADRGLIGTRRIPGCRRFFLRSDIIALAESSTKPATVEPQGAHQEGRHAN